MCYYFLLTILLWFILRVCRYLNAYEKLHHFGQDPDSREDTTDLDDLPSSRKKTVGPVGGVAVTYNYQQHNLHGKVVPWSVVEAMAWLERLPLIDAWSLDCDT